MAYTEIKKRNDKKYYYQVKSIRNKDKVSKKRIYLGVDLDKNELSKKIINANSVFKEELIYKKLENVRPQIMKIAKKYKIKKLGIFGSYARGDQKVSSDIDILIKPTRKMGFFDIIRLENELKVSLKKKIDLVTYRSVHRLLKSRIKKEEIRII